MEGQLFTVKFLDGNIPVLAEDVTKATKVDPILSKVHQFVLNGWPVKCDQLPGVFKPFYHRRDEISCEEGCVLWGARVVIPKMFQKFILDLLNWKHLCMCNMKRLARSYAWWPKLDADIESKVRACAVCQRIKSYSYKATYTPMGLPKASFSNIYFCEDKKQYFLILVDSYFQWVEVKPVQKTTVDKTLMC